MSLCQSLYNIDIAVKVTGIVIKLSQGNAGTQTLLGGLIIYPVVANLCLQKILKSSDVDAMGEHKVRTFWDTV